VIGVDEHRWAPRRVGAAGFVTLIIDLTPTHDHSGLTRLLDLVAGRSATALASVDRPTRRLRCRGAGGGDGRVRRLQDRGHRSHPRRGH
jgi:hypothetical protein